MSCYFDAPQPPQRSIFVIPVLLQPFNNRIQLTDIKLELRIHFFDLVLVVSNATDFLDSVKTRTELLEPLRCTFRVGCYDYIKQARIFMRLRTLVNVVFVLVVMCSIVGCEPATPTFTVSPTISANPNRAVPLASDARNDRVTSLLV